MPIFAKQPVENGLGWQVFPRHVLPVAYSGKIIIAPA
jgi:hypothetical protein